MTHETTVRLSDTGERMIPPGENEVSIVFARHRYTYRYAEQYVAGKSVLDLGCGTGYGCSLIGAAAARVVGIDRDPHAIEYCREHYPGHNIEYRRGDAETLAVDEPFDVAIAFQIIEHLAVPDNFLAGLKKAVKPGGTILITTPNSRKSTRGQVVNPFHVHDMDEPEFSGLLHRHFASCTIVGIGYASTSLVREFVLRSPLYRLGKMLARTSRIKKAATGAMGMTEYRMLEHDIARDAIDLLAVCVNV